MIKLTENFVDQVLHFKSISVAAKGGSYLTPLLDDLLHFRFMHKGEVGLQMIDYYVQLTRQQEAHELFSARLREFAERDGWDSEVSLDALEALSEYLEARYD